MKQSVFNERGVITYSPVFPKLKVDLTLLDEAQTIIFKLSEATSQNLSNEEIVNSVFNSLDLHVKDFDYMFGYAFKLVDVTIRKILMHDLRFEAKNYDKLNILLQKAKTEDVGAVITAVLLMFKQMMI